MSVVWWVYHKVAFALGWHRVGWYDGDVYHERLER